MAAETGHLDLAYDYLVEAALIDLHDLAHNTRDGLHLAALAGTWIALVPGLAGLRDAGPGEPISFAPRLPPGITRVCTTLGIHSSRLEVEITTRRTTYRVLDGPPVSLLHDGRAFTVSESDRITVANHPVPSREAPTQPRHRAPQPHAGAGQARAATVDAAPARGRPDASPRRGRGCGRRAA